MANERMKCAVHSPAAIPSEETERRAATRVSHTFLI